MRFRSEGLGSYIRHPNLYGPQAQLTQTLAMLLHLHSGGFRCWGDDNLRWLHVTLAQGYPALSMNGRSDILEGGNPYAHQRQRPSDHPRRNPQAGLSVPPDRAHIPASLPRLLPGSHSARLFRSVSDTCVLNVVLLGRALPAAASAQAFAPLFGSFIGTMAQPGSSKTAKASRTRGEELVDPD
jgi:hypothetical protein